MTPVALVFAVLHASGSAGDLGFVLAAYTLSHAVFILAGGVWGDRLERLELEVFAYHKENLLEEQKVNDIVMVAMEESWDAIMAHKEVIRTALELILRDGIEAGEFEPVDPRETSALIMKAFVCFCHPVLIAQGLQETQDQEADARSLIRFLLRAITPRK